MKNLTIAHRIIVMIVLSIASLLIVGLVGLSVANQGTASVRLIKDDSLASISTLGEARQAFMEIRVNVFAHIMNTDATAMQSIEKKLADNTQEIRKRLKDYDKLVSNAEDKKLLENDISNLEAYLNFVHGQVLPKSRKNENEAARNLAVTEGATLGAKTLKSFDEHMAMNAKLAEQTTADALASAARGKWLSLTTIALGFLAVAGMGIFLLRHIKSSLNQIQSMVNQVESSLDFTVRVSVRQQDEIGQTTSALNRLLDKLQGNLKSIASGANSVAAAAKEMAATSSQVSLAAHQQSEAASGMAATVEEMTVSINHVADRAQEANRISSESGALASSGEQVIGQTAQGINAIAGTVHAAADRIHELEQHSAQISNVVAVIKEVADQTNLLALNAAIEAARAGEQGRGFAVVADEVRKLAERTASSTQEIAHTIESMRAGASEAVRSMEGVVREVNQGVTRAGEATESIRQIGEGSRTAVDMVEEIATAIREQGTATNNIAVQVEKIAQMSEESSAAAGESARAAHDLDRLAGEMHGIVAAYRL